MPAPTRKPETRAQQRARTAAATAARREAKATTNGPLTFTFRDEQFQVTREHMASAVVYGRQKLHQRQNTVDSYVNYAFEVMGSDADRVVALCKPGDELEDVCSEFIGALNKAADVPNS